MRASLYRMERPTVTPEEGERERPATDAELLDRGLFVLGTLNGQTLVHAAPGVEPPEGAEVVEDGQARRWEWPELRDRAPEIADQVLRARVRTPDPVDAARNPPVIVSERMAQAANRTAPDEVEAVDLPPHNWAGDR